LGVQLVGNDSRFGFIDFISELGFFEIDDDGDHGDLLGGS
jgi:hypothetical protein